MTDAQLQLTVITKPNGILTKKVSKDSAGNLKKDATECRLSTGTGQVVTLQSLQELTGLISGLTKNQALTHGVPIKKNLPETFKIVSEKMFEDQPEIVTRTINQIEYSKECNHLKLIDNDPPKGQPSLFKNTDELLNAISKVLPPFKEAAKLITQSTSSCISDENGVELTGQGAGKHIYIVQPPLSDTKRFKDIFTTRAWINGYGYIALSKSGALLERNLLFDESVFSPERLDFVAGASLHKGWTQSRPDPIYIDGGVFDPAILPDLTSEEIAQYKQMLIDAKAAKKTESKQIQTAYIKAQGRKKYDAIKRQNPNDARTLANCEKEFSKSVISVNEDNYFDLYGDFELRLDEYSDPITVDQILDNPEKYDFETLSDPHEPEKGIDKARIFMNIDKGNGKPFIHSFVHGESKYFLHRDPIQEALQKQQDFTIWLETIVQAESDTEKRNTIILSSWTQKIIELDIDKIQAESCKNKVQALTRCGKTPLNQALKEAFKEHETRQAKITKNTTIEDRNLPEIEYVATRTGAAIESLSKALGHYNGANPVYRFGSSLVRVSVTRPATVRMAMKLCQDKENYPDMPVIKDITPETLRAEAEKACVFKGHLKNNENIFKEQMIPLHILKGLMSMPESFEKTLTGLIEHPFVDDNFNSVFKNGYDPTTGLIQFFKPKKYDFTFKNPVSFQDVKHSLDFICNEVFKDFPFEERIDLFGAIACLLTGMQRKIINGLTGCPGFLFDAPTQGTGKTTLAQMISYCLYNRTAAASSYAENDEEMGKHLLGILMEGHSSILFDNIKQGSRLENNELSKAMTSPTYSKRLLGANITKTVPSQVLWLFSGNNVILSGDFKTRVMPIRLNAKIADPDRRKFSRPDIAKWCEENRESILHACMTILIGSNIPEKATLNPSRFTDWDNFVRFPLIVATDGKIDIMDLFERNKQVDPQIEGLLIFFHIWVIIFKQDKPTANEILTRVKNFRYKDELTDEKDRMDEAFDTIREVLIDVFDGRLPTSQQLGMWLNSFKGKIIGNYLLESSIGTARHNKNIQCWHLTQIAES